MVAENKVAVADKVTEKPKEVTKEEKKGSAETTGTQVRLKSVNIKLPEAVHRQLKARSALEGVSASKLLTSLIEGYLKPVSGESL